MGDLEIFTIEIPYISYLRTFDPIVPIVSTTTNFIRPFVGVLISIDGLHYLADLSSPKEKFSRISNSVVDFHKLDNGRLGAIQLNNMIPVHDLNLLTVIDYDVKPDDTPDLRRYKLLIYNQKLIINNEKDAIIKKAMKLRNMILSDKPHRTLRSRCCNFKLLEENCRGFTTQ